MSKRVKHGIDVKLPNPTKTKRIGRSHGPMVFNEHVKCMVTPKINNAINSKLK